MGFVKQQFFPISDRPEVLVEVQMPEGTSIEATERRRPPRSRPGCASSPKRRSSPAYIGQGAPRFFLAMSPELPDPSFAKIVVLTPSEKAREALKLRVRAGRGAGPRARRAHPRDADRVRALFALPGRLPRDGAGRGQGPRDRRAGAPGHAQEHVDAAGQHRLGRARADRPLRARPGSPARDRPVLARCRRSSSSSC